MTPVVDLRQYTLHRGQRDGFVDLFDGFLVAGQEAAGMQIIGQFRDLDDPDRFVWLRGFESMPARGRALARFYQGPVWQQHRDCANAAMADSDNALLLEPLGPCGGLDAPRAGGPTDAVVAITVAYLNGPVAATDRGLADMASAALVGAGAEVVATLTTHAAPNNFPALPLREEHVLVWITRFSDDTAHALHEEILDAADEWRAVLRHLSTRTSQLPVQRLRLRPTDHSRLR